MASELQQEVRAFAEEHNMPHVGFIDDCIIDEGSGGFLHVECTNVSRHISALLSDTDGLLISAALISKHWGHAQFKEANRSLGSFDVSDDCLLAAPGERSTATWHTLFLFSGFHSGDVVAAYRYFLKRTPELYHVPHCYQHCYNEHQHHMIKGVITGRYNSRDT